MHWKAYGMNAHQAVSAAMGPVKLIYSCTTSEMTPLKVIAKSIDADFAAGTIERSDGCIDPPGLELLKGAQFGQLLIMFF